MVKSTSVSSGLFKYCKKDTKSVQPTDESVKRNTIRQLSEEEYRDRLRKTSMSKEEMDMVIQRMTDKGVWKNESS